MTKLELMGVLLCLLVSLLYLMSHRASKNPANPFNLGEAFVDATGKTSMARLSVFVALIISSWAFVALVVTESLTESFFTAYLAGFVLNGIGSKFADKRKPQDANTNP